MEKMYYSISEVADILSETQSTLRFWDSEFADMPGFLCRKNEKGTRRFSKQNLENCRMLAYLLREKKMTIEGAKKTLKAGGRTKGATNLTQEMDNRTLLERLVAIRNELQGMVDVYDDIIKGKEPNS